MARAGKSAITSHYAGDDNIPVLVVSCVAAFRQGQSKYGHRADGSTEFARSVHALSIRHRTPMISFEKHFLFVHIPKTAGNSIQSVLRDYSEEQLVALRKEQDGRVR
jgi:hypothetical protein